jgi:hypothetical protein
MPYAFHDLNLLEDLLSLIVVAKDGCLVNRLDGNLLACELVKAEGHLPEGAFA